MCASAVFHNRTCRVLVCAADPGAEWLFIELICQYYPRAPSSASSPSDTRSFVSQGGPVCLCCPHCTFKSSTADFLHYLHFPRPSFPYPTRHRDLYEYERARPSLRGVRELRSWDGRAWSAAVDRLHGEVIALLFPFSAHAWNTDAPVIYRIRWYTACTQP